MDQEKKPSEPVRLEVEALVDAIDEIEENEHEEDGRSKDHADSGRSIQDPADSGLNATDDRRLSED